MPECLRVERGVGDGGEPAEGLSQHAPPACRTKQHFSDAIAVVHYGVCPEVLDEFELLLRRALREQQLCVYGARQPCAPLVKKHHRVVPVEQRFEEGRVCRARRKRTGEARPALQVHYKVRRVATHVVLETERRGLLHPDAC